MSLYAELTKLANRVDALEADLARYREAFAYWFETHCTEGADLIVLRTPDPRWHYGTEARQMLRELAAAKGVSVLVLRPDEELELALPGTDQSKRRYNP